MAERFFSSLSSFAAFLGRAQVAEMLADQQARLGTAEFYVREIKDKIGDTDRLPPPLADSTVMQRIEDGYSGDETLLRTGKMRDSMGAENVSPRKTVAASSDPKAVWHELGPTNDHFPRRSFIASTAAETSAEAYALFVKIFGVSFHPR